MRRNNFVSIALITCGVVAVTAVASSVEAGENWWKLDIPASLVDPYIPAYNPITKAKVRLGERLFFDKQLSADQNVSCADCHNPVSGFSNAQRFGIGVKGRTTERNVPSLINAALMHDFFWDGRSATLEDQAKDVLLSPTEMGITESVLADRIAADSQYAGLFDAAFDNAELPLLGKVAMAIASYERTLLGGRTKFDDYWQTGNQEIIGESAYRGLVLFGSKAKCQACHEFWPHTFFTDFEFHNTGVGANSDTPDPGRYSVSKQASDLGKFRTPSLRNVAITAPYMHNGSLQTLEAVIEFYAGGGTHNANIDSMMSPFRLTPDEKRDLVAFLETLTSTEVGVDIIQPTEPSL